MNFVPRNILSASVCASLLLLGLCGCKAKADNPQPAAKDAPFMSAVTTAPPPAVQNPADAAPDPDKTGGFDGKRAYAQVAKQVSFGPRPAGSPALAQTQDYLLAELKSYGCTTEVDAFSSETPAGRIAMKIFSSKFREKSRRDSPRHALRHQAPRKFRGCRRRRLLHCRHARTRSQPLPTARPIQRLDRLLRRRRSRPPRMAGPRQLLWQPRNGRPLLEQRRPHQIKAFLLADIVGTRTPHFKRETYSTKALVDLVWGVAKKLGYANIFVDDSSAVEDDHQSFLKRHVPSVDVIDLDNGPTGDVSYWHTPKIPSTKSAPKP